MLFYHQSAWRNHGNLLVTWSASDPSAGSGVGTYTPDTPGHLYAFRLTATDNAGNQASAEAHTILPRVTKYYYHGGG